MSSKAEQRKAAIESAKSAYEQAVDLGPTLIRQTTQLLSRSAEAYFSQGQLEKAVKVAPTAEEKALYRVYQDALDKIDTTLCSCDHKVKSDSPDTKKNIRKDLTAFFRPRTKDAVVFIQCLSCTKVYAVSISEVRPVRANLEEPSVLSLVKSWFEK